MSSSPSAIVDDARTYTRRLRAEIREVELPALPRREWVDSRPVSADIAAAAAAAALTVTPPVEDGPMPVGLDAGTPLVKRCVARAWRGALGRQGELPRLGRQGELPRACARLLVLESGADAVFLRIQVVVEGGKGHVDMLRRVRIMNDKLRRIAH